MYSNCFNAPRNGEERTADCSFQSTLLESLKRLLYIFLTRPFQEGQSLLFDFG